MQSLLSMNSQNLVYVSISLPGKHEEDGDRAIFRDPCVCVRMSDLPRI